MTKLPRVTAKIFASDAAPNDIGQFGSALTGTKVSTGDIAEIQSLAAYKTGWRAAVISKRNYPTLQEMNGVQKTFSQQIAYNLQEGIAEYDPNTTYYKGSIVKALNSEEIPVLYYSLIDENVGNALDSENWAVLSVGGGGGTGSAGLNLFDTVLKDHILSFEESKGLALQGTYVYKDAVAGSRYGYPDFYNECVAQYSASTNILHKMSEIKQPIFTSNTTDGITISDSRNNTTVLQAIMNGTNSYNNVGNWDTYWINIDYATPTFLNNYTIQADSQNVTEYPSAWTLKGSNDGENFTVLDTQSNITFSGGESKTFNISAQTQSFKQYRIEFSAGVITADNNGELKKVTFDASLAIIIKKNTNGHIFYDIADKAIIDEIYNTTGTAWYYGVDTANERIFLPRNDNFVQCTENTADVGEFVEAGLPNITGNFTSLSYAADTNASGCFNVSSAGNSHAAGGNASNTFTYTFSAQKNNAIYGNSDTVQPAAVKKLVYMVVGNTEVTSSITDVTEITTSENDTLPLGYSFYQGKGTEPSVSWLASNSQWNASSVYTTFYNYAVNKIGDEFAAGSVVESSDTYTDYDLVINQNDMSFRLPLLNGNENIVDYNNSIILDNAVVLEKEYSIPKNGNAKVVISSTASNQYINVYVNNILVFNKLSVATNNGVHLIVENLKVGDVLKISSNFGGAKGALILYTAKGNGTLYFKVANAVENLELLDAGEVLESLANKVDYSNTQWATDACSPMAHDNNPYVSLSIPTSGTNIVAPANGIFYIDWKNTNSGGWVKLNNKTAYMQSNATRATFTGDSDYAGHVHCSKGDNIIISYGAVNISALRFIVMKGELND